MIGCAVAATSDGGVVSVLPDATAEVPITPPTSDKVATENKTTKRRITPPLSRRASGMSRARTVTGAVQPVTRIVANAHVEVGT